MFSVEKLFSVFFFCLIFLSSFTASAEIFDEERQAWILLNELRAEHGVEPVSFNHNSNLQNAAEIRAREISKLFSHDRPDGSSCFTAIRQAGVRYRTCGENIAMGTNLDAKTAMELWTNSQGHFKNMVNSQFTEIGIAAFRAGENIFWVQLFIG